MFKPKIGRALATMAICFTSPDIIYCVQCSTADQMPFVRSKLHNSPVPNSQ